MGRYKNALRQHLVADIVVDEVTGRVDKDNVPTDFLPLETYISNIEPNNTTNTEEVAYYHGDGTQEVDVLSISKGYTVTGLRYYGDEAQELIASKEGKTGEGAKIWHKIIRADGTKEFTGVATLSDIVTDGGEANAYEQFGCGITFDEFPEVTEVTPEG